MSKISNNVYNTARAEGEMDMVFIVNKFIHDEIGKRESALFMGDANISDVADKNSVVQRVIVNAYFTKLLLVFRDHKDVKVLDTLYFLVNDSEIEDWFTLFKEFVLPFIKKQNVYGVVYKKPLVDKTKGK